MTDIIYLSQRTGYVIYHPVCNTALIWKRLEEKAWWCMGHLLCWWEVMQCKHSSFNFWRPHFKSLACSWPFLILLSSSRQIGLILQGRTCCILPHHFLYISHNSTILQYINNVVDKALLNKPRNSKITPLNLMCFCVLKDICMRV
jgi:hypothetical protein